MDKVVAISTIELSPVVRDVWRDYTDAYADTFRNLLRRTDYQRWSYVLEQIDGGRLLDVGMGVGQFIFAASRTGRFEEVVGLDIRPHSELLRLDERVEFVWADVAFLPFPDDRFDVVTCMECIEHLDDDTLSSALPELRRVASNRLLMTVPWEEPEPLPKHHVQRFDRDRVAELFPDAEVTLLTRDSGVPWAVLDERLN